jgi:hypothetical protein
VVAIAYSASGYEVISGDPCLPHLNQDVGSEGVLQRFIGLAPSSESNLSAEALALPTDLLVGLTRYGSVLDSKTTERGVVLPCVLHYFEKVAIFFTFHCCTAFQLVLAPYALTIYAKHTPLNHKVSPHPAKNYADIK